MSNKPAARRRRWIGPLCALVSSCVALVAAELVFRALETRLEIDQHALKGTRDYMRYRRAAYFEPRPYFGWLLPESDHNPNHLGFFGDDWPLERKPGVLRIACMGGSTTAGGNPRGYEGSYPYFLRETLKRTLGREVEVMNCGISGWTTAEMVCAWFLLIQDYKPDLVILHEVINDTEPRAFSGFRPDYTHWRGVWRIPQTPAPLRWLVDTSDFCAWTFSRAAQPSLADATILPRVGNWALVDHRADPATMKPFRRNILSIADSVEANGGTLMLATLPLRPPPPGEPDALAYRNGAAEHNQLFRDLASARGWMLADLSTLAGERPESVREHFLDLVHVDPDANLWKAMCIAQVLVRQWPPLVAQIQEDAAKAAAANASH